MENQDEVNGAEQGEETKNNENLPAGRKMFTSDYQPSSDAKKAGWLKKKKNRELIQYMLQRTWRKNRMNEEFHDRVVEMTGLSKEELDELTYEGMLYVTQLIKAIKSGDTQAANLLLERAFGKPIQKLEFDGEDTPPPINITIQNGEADNAVPPIDENVNDI